MAEERRSVLGRVGKFVGVVRRAIVGRETAADTVPEGTEGWNTGGYYRDDGFGGRPED